MANDSGISGLLLMILLTLLFRDFGPPDQAGKFYLSKCASYSADSSCTDVRAGPSIEYHTLANIQSVVLSDGDELRRLNNCVVFDIKSWSCGSDMLGEKMMNGEYMPADFSPMAGMTQISSYRWYYLKTIEWKFIESAPVKWLYAHEIIRKRKPSP